MTIASDLDDRILRVWYFETWFHKELIISEKGKMWVITVSCTSWSFVWENWNNVFLNGFDEIQ